MKRIRGGKRKAGSVDISECKYVPVTPEWYDIRLAAPTWKDRTREVSRWLPVDFPAEILGLTMGYCERTEEDLGLERTRLLVSMRDEFNLPKLTTPYCWPDRTTETDLIQMELVQSMLRLYIAQEKEHIEFKRGLVPPTIRKSPRLHKITPSDPTLAKDSKGNSPTTAPATASAAPGAAGAAASAASGGNVSAATVECLGGFNLLSHLILAGESSWSMDEDGKWSWQITHDLRANETVDQVRSLVLLSALPLPWFRESVAQIESDYRAASGEAIVSAQAQAECHRRRVRIRQAFGFTKIHDEPQCCERANAVRPLDWASALYKSWLDDDDKSGSKEDRVVYNTSSRDRVLNGLDFRSTRQYGLRLVRSPRRESAPKFDDVGLVEVTRYTKLSELIAYVNANHRRMTEMSLESHLRVQKLRTVAHECKMAFSRLVIPRKQFAWYNQTPQTQLVIDAYRALIHHKETLDQSLIWNDPPTETSANKFHLYLFVPVDPNSHVAYRLVDGIIHIPAHFDQTSFDTPQFIKRLSVLVPNIVRPSRQ